MSEISVCELCGHSESLPAFSGSALEKAGVAMGRKEGISYRSCKKCSVLFQCPLLSQEEYDRFYQEVQRSKSTGYADNVIPKFHLERKQNDADFKLGQFALMQVLEALPGKRVFEIGPAEGTLLARLQDKGYEVSGIEPLAQYAEYAQNHFGLNVTTGFFNEETAQKDSADLVIIDNVLEHLFKPFDMLRLIRSTLSENGLLYLAIPSAEVEAFTDANIAHITLWTRRAVYFALESAGFRVLNIVLGRTLKNPHEWVCIAQAREEPQDIATCSPSTYPAPDLEAMCGRWNDKIAEYDMTLSRIKKYGALYKAYTLVARRLRAVGLFPKSVKGIEKLA